MDAVDDKPADRSSPEPPSDGNEDADGPAPASAAVFTTDALPEDQRFDVWRESISVLFDVDRPQDHGEHERFRASLTSLKFGPLLFGETVATGHRFTRDLRKAATDDIDHFLVQLYRGGGARLRCGEDDHDIRAGDIVVIDAAQQSAFDCGDFHNLTLVVPRRLLEKRLPGAERMHGRILSGSDAAGRLLGSNLQLMADLAAGENPAVLDRLADTAVELTARSLLMTETQIRDPHPGMKDATLHAVRQFLESRLGDPQLGPDSVLTAFRMSRTYLYDLFVPFGGVARYITRRRLLRSLAALRAPGNRHRKVADIACAHGFTSLSHFSRAFRATFGMTPGDARHMPPDTDPTPESIWPVDRRYEAWLRTMG